MRYFILQNHVCIHIHVHIYVHSNVSIYIVKHCYETTRCKTDFLI